MTKDDLVGVYRQLGEDVVNAEGVTVQTDNNRTSQIMYSADGYVGVVSTRNGRARVTNSDGRGVGAEHRCVYIPSAHELRCGLCPSSTPQRRAN